MGAYLREEKGLEGFNACICQQLCSLLLWLIHSLGSVTEFAKTEKTQRLMTPDTYTMRVLANSFNGLPSDLATVLPNLAKPKN
jgi:hypothetical protein